MKRVPVSEAKSRLSELLVAVEQGDQVTITRHGLPIARLVNALVVKRGELSSQSQQVGSTIASLRELRKGVALDGDLRQSIANDRD